MLPLAHQVPTVGLSTAFGSPNISRTIQMRKYHLHFFLQTQSQSNCWFCLPTQLVHFTCSGFSHSSGCNALMNSTLGTPLPGAQ